MTQTLYAYYSPLNIKTTHVQYSDEFITIGCDDSMIYTSDTYVLAMIGEFFNSDEIAIEIGVELEAHSDVELLSKLIHIKGIDDAITFLIGCYSIIYYNKHYKSWLLITDKLGSLYPYYYCNLDDFMISIDHHLFKNINLNVNINWLNRYIKGVFKPTVETFISGVYKLFGGMMYSYPTNEKIQYYDLYADLDDAFCNTNHDISSSCAVDYTHNIIKNTIINTSRNSDAPIYGVENSYGVDGLTIVAILNDLKIKPNTYTSFFPPQITKPNFNEEKNAEIVEFRMDIINKARNTFNAYNYFDEIVYDDVNSYIDPLCFKHCLGIHWGGNVFFKDRLATQAKIDGVTHMYEGGYGDAVFLHRTRYMIAYMLHQYSDRYINIKKYFTPEGTEAQRMASIRIISEDFSDILNKYDVYSYEGFDITSNFLYKFFNECDGDYIKYIIASSFIENTNATPDRYGRMLSDIPNIDVFKDIRLWKYMLQLPEYLMFDTMKKSQIQYDLIKKCVGDGDYGITKTDGFGYEKMTSGYDPAHKDNFYRASILYKHSDKTRNDFDAGLILMKDLGIDQGLIEYFTKLDEESKDCMHHELYRVLMLYYWHNEWKQ